MHRRSLVGLVIVLLSCATLGALGLRVEDKLAPLSLRVPGTVAANGEALEQSHFGESSPFIVLLRGPAAAVDRQGPRLVAALRRDATTTTLSPWDRGSVSALRPSPRKALVLVDFHVPLDEAMRDTVPSLERTLKERVSPPLVATQSGFASVSRALQEESLSSTERAELLAAPLLILVLLLVFRSVVAAAIPLAFGALTVFAGRGVLALLSEAMTIDALSLVVCTMMGLALGVDYSLLIVSRFREELERDSDPWRAAAATRSSAGRTTLFAGLTLIVALVFSAFLQPGSLLLSLATATAVVTVISVVISTIAVPALLGLLGPRINAGRIGLPPRPGGRSTVAAAAGAALRNPALAACLVAVPLLLLTLPVLGFATGAPGVDELPSSNQARQSAESIDRAVGPGWDAPFVLVAATGRGPITDREDLATLSRWQRRIAAEPGVRTVIGPAPIARRAAPLRSLGAKLTAGGAEGPQQIEKLGPGLRRAADAVSELRSGLDEGAAGSGLLAEGSERAAAGAGTIASELKRAAGKGEEATAAIGRLRDGSERLAKGQREVSVGSLSLTLGLRSLVPRPRGGEQARSRKLARELEAAAAEDPSLQPLANQARVLARTVAANRNEVRRLRDVAQEVNGGMNRLVPGGKRLEAGVGRLAEATDGLGGGPERLSSGLVELQGGAGALQSGLSEGSRRAYPLQTKLAAAGERVTAVATPLALGAEALRRQSPGLFDSGYFVLSALDGAPASKRAEAGEAISVDGGGQAARMLVVSDYPFNSDGSRRVGERLETAAAQFAAASRLETGDTVGAWSIFGVTFGLSIDYAVCLIARMRERYEVDGDNRAAIAFGLEKTAGVITGAAAIMAAVFVSFATAPIATVSQMGVGLTVAILLDATVVRIVLLPALMLLLGDRVWRVPSLLDRNLPRHNMLISERSSTGA